MFAALPVRRYSGGINGNHKTNILCALCASAVNKVLKKVDS